jgi:hypothetical protein
MVPWPPYFLGKVEAPFHGGQCQKDDDEAVGLAGGADLVGTSLRKLAFLCLDGLSESQDSGASEKALAEAFREKDLSGATMA